MYELYQNLLLVLTHICHTNDVGGAVSSDSNEIFFTSVDDRWINCFNYRHWSPTSISVVIADSNDVYIMWRPCNMKPWIVNLEISVFYSYKYFPVGLRLRAKFWTLITISMTTPGIYQRPCTIHVLHSGWKRYWSDIASGIVHRHHTKSFFFSFNRIFCIHKRLVIVIINSQSYLYTVQTVKNQERKV